jgi:MFS transporter, MCT family, solute carrier family 16 (monocarboxylic acid transporters), member 10
MNVLLVAPAWIFVKARLPPTKPLPFSHVTKPWREIRYTFLVIGCVIGFINFFVPYFNAILYAESLSTNPAVTAYAVAYVQLGALFGRIMAGFMADKIGIWRCFIFGGLSNVVVLLGENSFE